MGFACKPTKKDWGSGFGLAGYVCRHGSGQEPGSTRSVLRLCSADVWPIFLCLFRCVAHSIKTLSVLHSIFISPPLSSLISANKHHVLLLFLVVVHALHRCPDDIPLGEQLQQRVLLPVHAMRPELRPMLPLRLPRLPPQELPLQRVKAAIHASARP